MKHRSTIEAALRVTIMWACATACVQAQEHAPDAGRTAHAGSMHSDGGAARMGDATRGWLDLQRTNAAAAPTLPMPGAQATLAYERYLNSFRTKIPASFGSALSGESGAARGDYTSAGAGATPPLGAN